MDIKQYGYKKLDILPMEWALEVDETTQPGLYFICMPVLDFVAYNENTYIMKVGKASNIHNRMLQYKSMNPIGMHSAEYNTLILPETELRLAEIRCHNFLARFAVGVLEGTSEWFIIENQKWQEELFEIFNSQKPHWRKIALGE